MTDFQKNADKIDELTKGHFEQHFKNANLLLVGHAGALIACLAALKEYANIPQLRGIGFIIAIESGGLVLAILSYAGLSIGYFFLSSVPHMKIESDLPVPRIMTTALWFQMLSCVFLLVAIANVGIRLVTL
jgi:heme/copper-type cytochrome/quinol oxidase subunit 1